jgi:ribosomal protein S27AE
MTNEDDAITMTPHVEMGGVRYTIVPATCSRCGNTFFCPDHPEFNPRWCCYCGLKFVWYHEGKSGKDRFTDGRIKSEAPPAKESQ